MVIEKIIDIIIYAGVVQGFYLALLLHKSRSTQRGPNTILSWLLVIMSLAILHSLFAVRYINESIGSPIKIMEPFIFLIGPMLYFYTRRLVGIDMRLQARHALHLAPFFVFFAINLPFFLHDPESWYTSFFTSHTMAVTLVVWAILVTQYGAYFTTITRLIHVQLRQAREECSNIEDTDPSWVRFFMIVFLLLLVFLIIVLFSLVHFGGFVQFERAVSLIFSLSIFALGYKGLFQRGVSLRSGEPSTDRQPERPRQADLSRDDGAAKRIIEYMEEKKPFLNPDLTLTELAREVGMGRNQLSELINSGLGTNFYEFVNKYRIEEVKRLLAAPKSKVTKIIAVAFEAGFPSKSSFNNVFKKYTGLTPSEYRDRLS